MEKRFTALRIISVLYKILGVIIGIVTVLGMVFTVIAQPVVDFGFWRPTGALVLLFSVFVAVIELLFGGLAALGTYAIGDLVSLLVNIEENTRFTALIIRDRMQPAQPVQPMGPPPMQQQMPPPPNQVPPPPPPPPYQQ